MKFDEKDIYNMVDSLFYMFASYFRHEAKEELTIMLQQRKDKEKAKKEEKK